MSCHSFKQRLTHSELNINRRTFQAGDIMGRGHRGTERDIAFGAIRRVCNTDRLGLESRDTDMGSISSHDKDTGLHVDDPVHA